MMIPCVGPFHHLIVFFVFHVLSVHGQEFEEGHNFCDPNPCQNGGSCQSLATGYVCACVPGAVGYRCETNINDCAINSTSSVTKCQLVDLDAQCFDLLDGFKCACSPGYIGELCDITHVEYEEIKQFRKHNNNSEVLKLIELLIEDPTLFSDLAPFFINWSKASENWTKLSWTIDDLFVWASFAGRELELKNEIIRWNDPTLGNCFTFGQSGKIYQVVDIGENYGFQALLNVREADYLPWIKSASLDVYVQQKNEHIFSNSLHYSTPPGNGAQLLLGERVNSRLDDVYGDCANQTTDVNTFYSPGRYTVIGCLQSCYQNQVHLVCGCTDPRFLGIANISICGLEKAICVLNVSKTYGDPADWETCICPQQCYEETIDSLWYSANFVERPFQCWNQQTNNNHSSDECPIGDQVLLSVFFRSNVQEEYDETPSQTFNDYLFIAGGITGIIAGFSFISIIEFIFFCYRTFLTFCTNEYVTAEAKEFQFVDEDDANFDVFVEPPRQQKEEVGRPSTEPKMA